MHPGLDACCCCGRDLSFRHAELAAGCLAHPVLPQLLDGLQQGVCICLCLDHHVEVSCCQLQQPLHEKWPICCLLQSQAHKRGPRRLPIKSLLQAVQQERILLTCRKQSLAKLDDWQSEMVLENAAALSITACCSPLVRWI